MWQYAVTAMRLGSTYTKLIRPVSVSIWLRLVLSNKCTIISTRL